MKLIGVVKIAIKGFTFDERTGQCVEDSPSG